MIISELFLLIYLIIFYLKFIYIDKRSLLLLKVSINIKIIKKK